MRHILAIGIMVCALSSAVCRAESVVHDFDEMRKAGTLWWIGSDYTVGYTDLVTYTGSSGGTLGADGGKIGFSLPSKTSTLVISPAVPGLSAIVFGLTAEATPTWMKVYVSEDGSVWTDMSGVATYTTTTIDLVLPSAGDYYVKLVNNGKSSPAQPVFIRVVTYTYDPAPCNCFRYIAP